MRLAQLAGSVDRGEGLGWIRQHNPIAGDYNDFWDLALSIPAGKLPTNADEWGKAYDDWAAAGRPGIISAKPVQPIEPKF